MSRRVVLVTGSAGLVGHALRAIVGVQHIQRIQPHDQWIWVTRGGAGGTDLCVWESTRSLFHKYRPTHVIHLAGKVGGMFDNMVHQADYCVENALMSIHIVKACHEFGVKRLVVCLSTCIFPEPPPATPMVETHMHWGPPHPSNAGYAYSKRFLHALCESYSKQHGLDFVALVPCNLYGPHDNFGSGAHVLPDLIRKTSEGIVQHVGTGTAKRQFMYSEDFAAVLLWAAFDHEPMTLEDRTLIVAPDAEHSIRQVSEYVCKAVSDVTGRVCVDGEWEKETTNDGQAQKRSSAKRLMQLRPNTSFRDLDKGIRDTVQWFIDSQSRALRRQ